MTLKDAVRLYPETLAWKSIGASEIKSCTQLVAYARKVRNGRTPAWSDISNVAGEVLLILAAEYMKSQALIDKFFDNEAAGPVVARGGAL